MHRHLYSLIFSNGKQYIGISINPKARLAVHCHRARNNSRIAVHAAIRKYGIPELQILCIGNKRYIAALEIRAIAIFRSDNRKFGYNLRAGGNPGIEMTPEIRAKIGATQKGRKRSPIAIARAKATWDSQPDYHQRRGHNVSETKKLIQMIKLGITNPNDLLLCAKCRIRPRYEYVSQKRGLRSHPLCASCHAEYNRESYHKLKPNRHGAATSPVSRASPAADVAPAVGSDSG